MKPRTAWLIAWMGTPSVLWAQVYTAPPVPPVDIDPSGEAPPPSPATNANPYVIPGTNIMIGTPQPPATPKVGDDKTQEGLYLGPQVREPGRRWEGALPDVHVVQKGDTLWDICSYYFGNPWRWPELWGLNPEITNPHWIYPGNLVRLAATGATRTSATIPSEQEPQSASPPSPTEVTKDLELRQMAFVASADLQLAGTIHGSTEERELLSVRDEVFIEYPPGKPPQVGTRYSIYSPKEDIVHPNTGQVIGKFVRIRGEARILDVKMGKTARAVISDVTTAGIIERGARVGPLKTQYHLLPEVPPTASVEGVIAGVLGTDDVIGDGQLVFIDRGSEDGLRQGNRMQVIRRGDALPPWGALKEAEDDRRYPESTIGQVIILEAGARTAIGWVVRAGKELEVGDHVLIRKPK